MPSRDRRWPREISKPETIVIANDVGDELHSIIQPAHPYLPVGRRAGRFEDVDKVVSEFVSEGPYGGCCPEPDLTVCGECPPVVLLPGVDPPFTVKLDRQPPRRPTLTCIGTAPSVEGQFGFLRIKPPGDGAHQTSGLVRLDGVAITESGDEVVVAAERADPVFVAWDPLARLGGSRLHGMGLSASFVVWAQDVTSDFTNPEHAS